MTEEKIRLFSILNYRCLNDGKYFFFFSFNEGFHSINQDASHILFPIDDIEQGMIIYDGLFSSSDSDHDRLMIYLNNKIKMSFDDKLLKKISSIFLKYFKEKYETGDYPIYTLNGSHGIAYLSEDYSLYILKKKYSWFPPQ